MEPDLTVTRMLKDEGSRGRRVNSHQRQAPHLGRRTVLRAPEMRHPSVQAVTIPQALPPFQRPTPLSLLLDPYCVCVCVSNPISPQDVCGDGVSLP